MPAPEKTSGALALAFRRVERRISSSAVGQSRPHAALRGVHRLGDAEAEVPQSAAVGDGRVPVDRRLQPGIDSASGSATTCAAEKATRLKARCLAAGKRARRGEVGLDGGRRAVGAQRERRHRRFHADPPDSAAARRSSAARCQLCSAHSTSCTPLAPSTQVVNGASSTTWRMNISHCDLEAVVVDDVVRHLLPVCVEVDGSASSGFQTGRGVSARLDQQSVRPATAEPCVPSTWKVTRSSR